MTCECNGMSCKRGICCGTCDEKSTCAHVCKTCVPSDVTAATESNADTHTENSSDEE